MRFSTKGFRKQMNIPEVKLEHFEFVQEIAQVERDSGTRDLHFLKQSTILQLIKIHLMRHFTTHFLFVFWGSTS